MKTIDEIMDSMRVRLYHVSYDADAETRKKIDKYLRGLVSMRMLESSWIVQSNLSADELRNQMPLNDAVKYFISEITKNAKTNIRLTLE